MRHAHAWRLAIAMMIGAPFSSSAQAPSTTLAEVLRVSSYADAGEGTLRAAIERSNAAPGRIDRDPRHRQRSLRDQAGVRAAPDQGPGDDRRERVEIAGELIAIDGSGYIESKGMETCPGADAGQYGANIRTTALPGLALVDTQGVDIGGLEIRKFCIGILIHRASGNVVHDNRIVGNRGGAGVMLTGDDGSGNPTAGTTVHNKVLRNVFVDNGDGLELTRGAAFNRSPTTCSARRPMRRNRRRASRSCWATTTRWSATASRAIPTASRSTAATATPSRATYSLATRSG